VQCADETPRGTPSTAPGATPPHAHRRGVGVAVGRTAGRVGARRHPGMAARGAAGAVSSTKRKVGRTEVYVYRVDRMQARGGTPLALRPAAR
jgi:hypothetical protein